jgi:hypothetical protein
VVVVLERYDLNQGLVRLEEKAFQARPIRTDRDDMIFSTE